MSETITNTVAVKEQEKTELITSKVSTSSKENNNTADEQKCWEDVKAVLNVRENSNRRPIGPLFDEYTYFLDKLMSLISQYTGNNFTYQKEYLTRNMLKAYRKNAIDHIDWNEALNQWGYMTEVADDVLEFVIKKYSLENKVKNYPIYLLDNADYLYWDDDRYSYLHDIATNKTALVVHYHAPLSRR